MANHGFVTVRMKLTPERVDKDIREIVKRRFKNALMVEGPSLFDDKKTHGWMLSVKDQDNWQFSIWLSSPRKLEFRHPLGAEWLWWAQVLVMTEELAVKYHGIISDEGVGEKWKGNPLKYPTFESWLDARFPAPDDWKGVAEQLKRETLAMLPAVLKEVR